MFSRIKKYFKKPCHLSHIFGHRCDYMQTSLSSKELDQAVENSNKILEDYKKTGKLPPWS